MAPISDTSVELKRFQLFAQYVCTQFIQNHDILLEFTKLVSCIIHRSIRGHIIPEKEQNSLFQGYSFFLFKYSASIIVLFLKFGNHYKYELEPSKYLEINAMPQLSPRIRAKTKVSVNSRVSNLCIKKELAQRMQCQAWKIYKHIIEYVLSNISWYKIEVKHRKQTNKQSVHVQIRVIKPKKY